MGHAVVGEEPDVECHEAGEACDESQAGGKSGLKTLVIAFTTRSGTSAAFRLQRPDSGSASCHIGGATRRTGDHAEGSQALLHS